MSEELTFYANRTKATLLLPVACLFVIGGYSMRVENPLIGWSTMIFFGFGVLVLLFMIVVPKATYLRLDTQGFEYGSVIYRKRIEWQDVQDFRECTVRNVRMIEIVYAPHYKQQAGYRAFASGLSGVEGAIPDNYNAPLDQILRTLNEWRTRFGR